MSRMIYSKFSTDRDPSRSIITEIMKDEEQLMVRKRAYTEAGQEHIDGLLTKYERLSNLYTGSVFCVNTCTLIEGCAYFEYLKGRTLEDALDDCLISGNITGFRKLIDLFVEGVKKTYQPAPFQISEDFIKVFGEVDLPLNVEASHFVNVDMLFSNIKIEDSNWQVIDYEWVFDFLIPINFLIYRTFFYYTQHNTTRSILLDDNMMRLFGITTQEIEQYKQMDIHFISKYVEGGRNSIHKLHHVMGKQAINLNSMLKAYKKEIEKMRCQVFYDFGEGFNEEDSDIIEPKWSNESLCELEFIVPGKVKYIRIDPGDVPCMLAVLVAQQITQDCNYEVEYVSNSVLKDKKLLEFVTDDPNIIITNLREDARKIFLRFDYEPRERSVFLPFARNHEATRKELERTKDELERTKDEQERTKEELRLTKEELKVYDAELEKILRSFSWRLVTKLNKLLPEHSNRKKIVKALLGRRFHPKQMTTEEQVYGEWIKQNEPNREELKAQKATKFEKTPKISVVVPLYNTPEKFFEELLESLQRQTYSNWELCLGDGSLEPISYIEKYMKKDNRIKCKTIGKNKGISGNTNEALTLVTGDYIGLLDHDDYLPPFSLYEIVKTINENLDVEFIYTDEDRVDGLNGLRYGVFFKPDFSQYTLRSANYICHFSVFKKELMDKLGGFRLEYDGSQDFDIVIRASEQTDKIVHIPKVLYHWRVHQDSVAGNAESKPYAYEVAKNVIKNHLDRCNVYAEVTDGISFGSYEVRYRVKGTPKVSIIIVGNNTEEELDKIVEEVKKSKYSNYEIITLSNENYNEILEKCTGDYFMIMDENLTKIDNESYIEELLGICQDLNVGIVGTKLYNKEKLVEHSGIIVGMNGVGDYLYKGMPKDMETYMQRLQIIHNVSAVYYKYSMISKKVFEEIKGYADEAGEMLISIDTCLKILALNKQVVMNPMISFEVKEISKKQLIKEQEDKFIEKWKEQYEKGDIYFSPNLSKSNTDLSIKIE